jgi:hypothetical protein
MGVSRSVRSCHHSFNWCRGDLNPIYKTKRQVWGKVKVAQSVSNKAKTSGEGEIPKTHFLLIADFRARVCNLSFQLIAVDSVLPSLRLFYSSISIYLYGNHLSKTKDGPNSNLCSYLMLIVYRPGATSQWEILYYKKFLKLYGKMCYISTAIHAG